MATHRANRRQPRAALAARPPRRGVILLVVLSLLALFVLIGVMYALLASQYYVGSQATIQINRTGDNPEKEFDIVLTQLLADSQSRSAMRFHSLLDDLYGRDFRRGFVSSITPHNNASSPNDNGPQWPNIAAGGQVFGFQVSPGALDSFGNTVSWSNIHDYYVGRVLTFTTGNLAGLSARIVMYDPSPAMPPFASNSPQLYIETVKTKFAYSSAVTPQVNDQFVINGLPFNGAGAGYDSNTQNLDATYTGYDPGSTLGPKSLALLPHINGLDPNYLSPQPHLGGLDESWDAVDYQNMFLALCTPAVGLPVIPSYHRPELVNYWKNNLPTGISDPLDPLGAPASALVPFNPLSNGDVTHRDFLRSFILRPMPWDHPNFSGTNPNFDAAMIRADLQTNYGVNDGSTPTLNQQVAERLLQNLINQGNNPQMWDIDNDADGIKDSIWIDPGLPVVTSPNGKRYKRMVALLIKDLDGRINLNAHGNLAQVPQFDTTGTIPYYGKGNSLFRAETALTGNVGLAQAGQYLPRGIGFGPAEVDFFHLFRASGIGSIDQQFLAYCALLRGRYQSAAETNITTAEPGLQGVRDQFSVIKHHGVPNDYNNQFSWYASPPDVWGRGAIVLDYGGQPLYGNMGLTNEVVDAPYEFSPNGDFYNSDTPYNVAELERMLRINDADAQHLFCRPLQLATAYLNSTPGTLPTNDPAQQLRDCLTTISSDIPTPGTSYPAWARSAMAGRTPTPPTYEQHGSILDLYQAKLENGGVTTSAALAQEMAKIIPWELRQGGKFNINRWLGDGADTVPPAMAGSPDNVPDDPSEAFLDGSGAPIGPTPWGREPAWSLGGLSGIARAEHSNGFDVDNDNDVDRVDRALARQLYARHLFCLAMLFINPNFQPKVHPSEAGTLDGTPQNHNLFVRRLAQWAINAVDFRDADSIMTPFEFDYNPWDGWNVDGQLGSSDDGNTTRGLVWGVETPDLLISESLAFHSKNVKDTKHDDEPANIVKERSLPAMGMVRDATLDQFRVPQGSLFLELQCVRNRFNRNQMLPRELYDFSSGPAALALGKVSSNGWPVWRLAITKLEEEGSMARARHPNNMVDSNPETASFEVTSAADPQPRTSTLLTPGITGQSAPSIDRFVWFTTPANAPGVTGDAFTLARSFFSNGNANPRVEPGQYAIVGPRARTYLGSKKPAMKGTWEAFSEQYIDIPGSSTKGITVNGIGGTTIDFTTPPNSYTFAAVPIIASMSPAVPLLSATNGVAWTQPWSVGLNISEPLPDKYYKMPSLMGMETPPDPSMTIYDIYNSQTSMDDTLPDVPFDDEANGINTPVAEAKMYRSGTYQEAASVFLQRLANPNLPHDPTGNPYLTVDWAAIDLTVFAGEEDISDGAGDGGNIDQFDAPGRLVLFRTRQRGQLLNNDFSAPLANHWPPATRLHDPTIGSPQVDPNFYFPYSLDGTSTPPDHTFPFLNSTVGTPSSAYYGEAQPFQPSTNTYFSPPWLTFHNRPFSNPMELLNVPSSAPSRLGYETTLFAAAGNGVMTLPTNTSPYGAASNTDQDTFASFRGPFLSLLNFFATTELQSSLSNPPTTAPPETPELYRLLDYVEVPSPYLGTERWYNPTAMTSAPGIPAQSASNFYRPPFNKLSRFRDPGRININTILDPRVFYAAAGGAPIGGNDHTFADLWQGVFQSRQGYGGAGSYLAMDPAFPTRFANPIRPSDTSDLMPNVPNLRKHGVQATLLRPDANQLPLLQMSVANHDDWSTLSTAPNAKALPRDISRNPYFRYQALQKLGSTFTTHSNCFAVWMTVGYFEVEPVPGYATMTPQLRAAWPDGYALGAEIGSQTGEAVRHRAFFIIDRSVPVGFIPGQRLNVHDCVLLRRMIE
ncbi:MAG: hypothetical protein SFU86_16475 [Pirellulaceae bacterium]|nr:hypothetical protein [Pirellulaceae bacterium]